MDEGKKDFTIKTEGEAEIRFSRKFKVSLTIVTFLTGFSFLASVAGLVDLFLNEWGNHESYDYFSRSIAFFLVMLMCFVTFVSILSSKRPFSITLVHCLNAIAIILIVCSGLISFIPGAYSSFIMGWEGGFFLDGYYATTGFLIFVFAKLFHYGLEYQNRSDTTI